jgi:hypothetical protein
MVQSDGMSEFVGGNHAQVKTAVAGRWAAIIKAEVFPPIVEHHVKFKDDTGSPVVPGVSDGNGATSLGFPEEDDVLIILPYLGSGC